MGIFVDALGQPYTDESGARESLKKSSPEASP